MKKLFLLIALLLSGLYISAQNEVTYGIAKYYQVKVSNDKWGEWEKIEGKVLVYFDMGFGFISVLNKNIDKFIVLEYKDVIKDKGKTIYNIRAIDKNGIKCNLYTIFFESGNFSFTISYSDIQYSYLIEEEFVGYPYGLFTKPTKKPINKEIKKTNNKSFNYEI